MALVTELELPQLDHLAEDLKGERFHDARMPGVELGGEPELGSIHGIYGPERLPLRWR
jgi:hypothetical protein